MSRYDVGGGGDAEADLSLLFFLMPALAVASLERTTVVTRFEGGGGRAEEVSCSTFTVVGRAVFELVDEEDMSRAQGSLDRPSDRSLCFPLPEALFSVAGSAALDSFAPSAETMGIVYRGSVALAAWPVLLDVRLWPRITCRLPGTFEASGVSARRRAGRRCKISPTWRKKGSPEKVSPLSNTLFIRQINPSCLQVVQLCRGSPLTSQRLHHQRSAQSADLPSSQLPGLLLRKMACEASPQVHSALAQEPPT